MSQRQTGNSTDDDDNLDTLQRLLVEGVGAAHPGDDEAAHPGDGLGVPLAGTVSGRDGMPLETPARSWHDEDDDEDNFMGESLVGTHLGSDIQGATGLFAEAAQDMATAGVELSLGRHFACADFCNQAAEKAAQAVSLLRFGRRSMYDHDLRTLGVVVGAPLEIQDEMAILTPFHPESFYADTPPEEADEVINAEQASGYVQNARHVLRWARNIVLNA